MECPSCHSSVQDGFVHCKYCGGSIAPSPDAKEPDSDRGELTMSSAERQDDDFELGALPQADNWQFSREEGWVPTPRMSREVPLRSGRLPIR